MSKRRQTWFSRHLYDEGGGAYILAAALHYGGLGARGMAASISKPGSRELQDRGNVHPSTAAMHRRRSLGVLFIHRDADAVDLCVQELEKAQFTVSTDFALNLAQGTERIHAQSYDVVVAEYPSPSWKGSRALQVFKQTLRDIPLIFLTPGSEVIGEVTAHGAFDFVERERVAQLPMAVRRALNERELRAELAEAGKALRHSQSLYRALIENPAYGICWCDGKGKFLDVNQALVTMLGYVTREELLAARDGFEVMLELDPAKQGVRSEQMTHIETVEKEWKRKNGSTLKARLSGRGVYNDQAELTGYEIIVVDITEQRALEEHLRRQASSDSLTGLVNHRHLFEVLHAEIARSKRTDREFSLLLLDLDGLKGINDGFGHQTGDRALCRLAQTLGDCCRSIDTAARQGGDEFALVLPETGASAAALVARRICDLVARDAEKPVLSVSVGVASFPNDADTVGSLLSAADRALYAMKEKQPRVARSSRADGAERTGLRGIRTGL